MRNALAAIVLLAVSSCASSHVAVPAAKQAPVSAASAPVASLAASIDARLADPAFAHALWAIDVEDDDGTIVYQRNAHTLMIPASNRKLFAAAAVANCEGLDHQYATELLIDGRDLVLRGGGDPSLGGRYLQERALIFQPFVDALRARGVRAIEGDLVADVSLFDATTLPPSWKLGYLGESYATPIDALAYNENVVGVDIDHADCAHPIVQTDPWFVDAKVRVTCDADDDETSVSATKDNVLTISGRVPPWKGRDIVVLGAVGDPALYAAQALRDALAQAGIPVRGALRVERTRRAGGERIATIWSAPLHQLLATTLKVSQNLYIDMMLKGLTGSFDSATALERDFLVNEAGVDPREFRFVDGSGLAPDDLVAPAAVVKLLRWMNAPVRHGAFWNLYSTPAEEGTLRRRLTELAPRVRAKTGTLGGVNALSGIIAMPGGRYRYFSIIANHHVASSSQVNAAIDGIVRELAR